MQESHDADSVDDGVDREERQAGKQGETERLGSKKGEDQASYLIRNIGKGSLYGAKV